MAPDPLSPDALAPVLDVSAFDFDTTDDVADIETILGQDRALEAIAFGAAIRKPGYNLFLIGEEGTGRHWTLNSLIAKKASTESTPDDWVYVSNFEIPHRPRAISLPPGRGVELADAMVRFIEDVRASVSTLFESEETQTRLQAIQEEFAQKQGHAFEELRQRAESRNIALIRTPMGFGFAPTVNKEVVKPAVFEKLPESERSRIQADIEALQQELQAIIKQIPKWDRERREAIRELRAEIVTFAIDESIAPVRDSFAALPAVVSYLDDVRRDLIGHFDAIMAFEQASEEATEVQSQIAPSAAELGGFAKYRVNPIVSNRDGDGAPIVYEDNPTLANLVGRIEHVSRFGALVTDFSLIKAGALHRANGGYLILDARKLLTQPFAWEALKRALKGGRINIEGPGQMLSLISTVSLEPEPIPLQTKIAICGDQLVYYLLSMLDPEFLDLFKVEADFDNELARSAESERDFVRLVASLIRGADLRPFDSTAIHRVAQHAVRLAADQQKLSIRMRSIVDLLQEADFFAGENGATNVAAGDVQQAIDAQIRRSDRLREKGREAIERDIVLIQTSGSARGQINGLSVVQLGGFAFGRPTRITARVRLGAGKVIDIEREVELGGPIHSKGVLILSGFLAARYAIETPLSLSATLVFEQSYGGVEGDSASSAELYALLSALAGADLRQDLAVTGSVNQNGDVQAIGGVNEKIEGFHDICVRRGLTGTQGVLIPKANVQHLVLRKEVIDDVKAGRFHIYPVETIDQGIELLTGIAAGSRDESGAFPAGTINDRVERRLLEFAHRRRAFAKSSAESEGDQS
jgi:lon-related putative ATP-dependent protease